MTTSALLEYGVGLAAWLKVPNLAGLDRMRRMLSQSNITHPEDYQRANYFKILQG